MIPLIASTIRASIQQPLATMLFRVSFYLYVHSDSVHICTETSSIALGILRAKSDSGASLQFDRRPMALPCS
jgi:hypothetical protein